MKNHLLALALAACFCAAASEGIAAKNLLKNGDFKEVNIGAPSNWTLGKDTAFSVGLPYNRSFLCFNLNNLINIYCFSPF